MVILLGSNANCAVSKSDSTQVLFADCDVNLLVYVLFINRREI